MFRSHVKACSPSRLSRCSFQVTKAQPFILRVMSSEPLEARPYHAPPATMPTAESASSAASAAATNKGAAGSAKPGVLSSRTAPPTVPPLGSPLAVDPVLAAWHAAVLSPAAPFPPSGGRGRRSGHNGQHRPGDGGGGGGNDGGNGGNVTWAPLGLRPFALPRSALRRWVVRGGGGCDVVACQVGNGRSASLELRHAFVFKSRGRWPRRDAWRVRVLWLRLPGRRGARARRGEPRR
jgi:hypothetical protein